MNSIEKDSRFSRVLTDPRFLPMPTYERKVKIDKRFNALFTSKDFGHRTLLDKRGRPIRDVSKRSKHVMEQFYQLSSEDSSDSDDEKDSDIEPPDDDEDSVTKSDSPPVSTKSKSRGKKRKKEATDSDSEEGGEEPIKKVKKMKKKVEVQAQSNIANVKGKQDPIQKKKSVNTKGACIAKGKEDCIELDSVDDRLKAGGKTKGKQTDSDEEEDNDEDEDSSESDSSSDDEDLPEYTLDFELEETTVEHKWNEQHADAPTVSESTHRLAVCNMDWDFIKAQDLFVLFKSFAVEGGSVRSVIIYPSEFGKERMAEEARLGPREMRNLKGEEKQKPSVKRKGKARERIMDQQKLRKVEKKKVKDETEVLREYQLNRMRYYYAVVDCSSVEVADNIYKECDGHEYQLSSVQMDLRFIPDDMTFDDTPKESFTEEQGLVDYTPKLFNSTALSQAKVEVTWDETDFDRLHRQMVHFQHKELVDIVEENKYSDIIAPPESDSDGEGDGRPQWLKSVLAEDDEDDDVSEEKKISLYRKVLMDKLVEEEEKEKKENEVDKELEWQPGLKSAVESKLKKSGEKVQGTIVDGYLEKKKEKKRKKRELKKAEAVKSDDDDDDDDEVPNVIDDGLREMMESEGVDFKAVENKGEKTKKLDKKKKKKKIQSEECKDGSEDERERAELELLLMEDEHDDKKVAKTEKTEEGKLSRRQKIKKKLLAKEQKKKEKEQEFAVDVNDPRFSVMFQSHHFHIDPSAPEFKKTENMMKLVDEQIKRKSKEKKGNSLQKGDSEVNSETQEASDSRAVSKKLLESLKRKMKR